MVKFRRKFLVVLALTFLLISTFTLVNQYLVSVKQKNTAEISAAGYITLSGIFTVVWQDEIDKQDAKYYLTISGKVIQLDDSFIYMLEGRELSDLIGQKITLSGQYAGPSTFNVSKLESVEKTGFTIKKASLSGKIQAISEPWLTLLCKASDITLEPKPQSYFDTLLGDAEPGLKWFWREISGGAINLNGGQIKTWKTMSGTRASYIGPDNYPDLSKLTADCLAAHSITDVSQFYGVDIFYNFSTQNIVGQGGFSAINGQTKAMTWMAYLDNTGVYYSQNVLNHERGHAHGWNHAAWESDDLHSTRSANGWDMMSYSFLKSHPVLGYLSGSTNTWNTSQLNWAAKRTVLKGQQATITLHRRTSSYEAGTQAIEIPTWGNTSGFYYAVELICKSGVDLYTPYSIPANGQCAVLIHRVYKDPLSLIGISGVKTSSVCLNPQACDLASEEALWRPGETYVSANDCVSIQVINTNTVTVKNDLNNQCDYPSYMDPFTVESYSNRALFYFSSYKGPIGSVHRVDVSTHPQMLSDIYLNFAQGNFSPIFATSSTSWDKYTCGRNLYWKIIPPVSSTAPIPVQSFTVGCKPWTPIECKSLEVKSDQSQLIATGATVYPGQLLNYSLTYKNNVPFAYSGTITATLPSNLTWLRSTRSCTQSLGKITCQLTNVPANDSKTISLAQVYINPSSVNGPLNVTATITSKDWTDLSNCSASQIISQGSPTIIQNSATGKTCHEVCATQGKKCVSIGTDAPAFNRNTMLTDCSLYPSYGCTSAISNFGNQCSGRTTQWTNCRCQPN